MARQWDQLLLKDDVLYRGFEDTTGNQHSCLDILTLTSTKICSFKYSTFFSSGGIYHGTLRYRYINDFIHVHVH